MDKALFLPFGVFGALLAGIAGRKLFDVVWSRFDDEEAPEPKQRDVAPAKLVAALALQGAIFRLARGIVERGSRRGFERMTGVWPGEPRPEPT